MSLEWEQVVISASDPAVLGRWWCEALGWVVVDDSPPVFEIQPELDRLPGMLFLAVDGDKETTNRLHIDLRPDDQEAEVCLLYTSPSPRDLSTSRMPSSA